MTLPLLALVLAAPPLQEQVEADLRLELVLTSPAELRRGERPAFDLRLVNTSKTRTHQVVRPGVGSETGFREPLVRVDVDGPRPVRRRVCGNDLLERALAAAGYDWTKDIVAVPPGRTLGFGPWRPPLDRDRFAPGRYTFAARYEVRTAGEPPAEFGRGPKPGAWTGPAFTLTSKPVVVVVAAE